MGVQTRIIIHAPTRDAARAGAERAFARIASLEQAMSDYRPQSELSLLCARAQAGDHDWQDVSFDLFRALALSQTLAAKTDGAFSATIGPAVQLWRRARHTGTLPDEAQRQEAVRLSDWRLLEVDRETRRVRLHAPGVGLDLGGIGKGYAAQAALDELTAIGLPRSLVALGGDIAVGLPPWNGVRGEEGWRIALRTCLADLLLANCAVSTSGDNEQFVEIGSRRFSHIVDPRTGLGVVGGPWVSVVASRGEYADAPQRPHRFSASMRPRPSFSMPAAAVFVERAMGRNTTTVIDPRGLLAGSAREPVQCRLRTRDRHEPARRAVPLLHHDVPAVLRLGAWYVSMTGWMNAAGLGPLVGWAYTVGPIAAIVSPFFVGMIADRFFPTQIVLAVLHVLGGGDAGGTDRGHRRGPTTEASFTHPYVLLLLAHMLCYMPTLALTNSLSFSHLASAPKFSADPRVRHHRLDRGQHRRRREPCPVGRIGPDMDRRW